MPTIKRINGSSQSLTGTASLNSLGSGSVVVLDEYDNSSNLWPTAHFEFVLDFNVGPSTDGAPMELWVVPAPDGTNYVDGASGGIVPRSNLSIGLLPVRNVNTSQRLSTDIIPIPPFKFKLVVRNSAGQALDASGNSAKIFPHGLQSV